MQKCICRGSGLVFASKCPEDKLDKNWQRLILTHLMEKTHIGVLTGSPITDMKITLVSGRSHIKHTEGGDFRQATYRAVRQGLMQAENVLLEPWYEFSLTIPAEYIGRALNDMQLMCADFSAPEQGPFLPCRAILPSLRCIPAAWASSVLSAANIGNAITARK